MRSTSEMFDSIAYRYNLANDAISLGLHRMWRRVVLKRIPPLKINDKVLDACTGSGDEAFSILAKYPEVSVIGIDASKGMIAQAQKKARKLNKAPRFIIGQAENLPFESKSFSLVTCSFGIRNVANTNAVLGEFLRVLLPGAMLSITEFGKPKSGFMSCCYSLWSSTLLPWIGGRITGDREAYDYLVKSAVNYPSGRDFLEILEKSGFHPISAKSLPGSIAWHYLAKKKP